MIQIEDKEMMMIGMHVILGGVGVVVACFLYF